LGKSLKDLAQRKITEHTLVKNKSKNGNNSIGSRVVNTAETEAMKTRNASHTRVISLLPD